MTENRRQLPQLTPQQHSINLFSEDFIAGYMHDGRMSVVRRFFCLFVTFDLVFISLLWVICIVIQGANIKEALENEIIHYNIEKSLFDIVMLASSRFLTLILFYALLYISHWFIIAVSTSCSCAFLIYKVFVFDWQSTPQPVFQVLIIIISFVIAWGEAWFLDCRVIPQERYASVVAISASTADLRTPLLNAFSSSLNRYGPPESIHNFYSPFDSPHQSDNEEDKQEEDYRELGTETVLKAYEYLESTDWKVEKITSNEDVIQSTTKPIGKIFKLTGKVNYPADLLLNELFYRIEEVPQWNPTILESKIIRKIDGQTDLSYSTSAPGGAGLVKSRDFINLRCWRLCSNGEIVQDFDIDKFLSNVNNKLKFVEPNNTSKSFETIVEINEDPKNQPVENELHKSNSDSMLNIDSDEEDDEYHDSSDIKYVNLSKSLGAKNFAEKVYQDKLFKNTQESMNKVYISAAVSVDYPEFMPSSKYIRGQNIISCWAMRELKGNDENKCIFEWLLCMDLKGSIPKYVLNAAYITLMQDYMVYLRRHIEDLKAKREVQA